MRISIPTGPFPTSHATAEFVRDPARPDVVTLLLDGVESSSLDLEDPAHLEFEYMQHLALLAATRLDTDPERVGHPRILHVGAAGCALPRALAARHDVHQVAVELDAELARIVRESLPLPRSPSLKIRVDNGRTVLDTTKAHWALVVRDAFANRRVPGELGTLESAQAASRVVEPNGAYLLNCISAPGDPAWNRDLAALSQYFGHLVAIADPAVVAGKRVGNVVVGAAHTPWDTAAIEREVRRLALPARMIDDHALRTRARSAKATTDVDEGWAAQA